MFCWKILFCLSCLLNWSSWPRLHYNFPRSFKGIASFVVSYYSIHPFGSCADDKFREPLLFQLAASGLWSRNIYFHQAQWNTGQWLWGLKWKVFSFCIQQYNRHIQTQPASRELLLWLLLFLPSPSDFSPGLKGLYTRVTEPDIETHFTALCVRRNISYLPAPGLAVCMSASWLVLPAWGRGFLEFLPTYQPTKPGSSSTDTDGFSWPGAVKSCKQSI